MLTKQEYETVKQLIDLSTTIKNLYCDLYQLEISTGKQTSKYNEIILKIKQLLKIQEEVYLRLKENPSSNEKILNYIISNYKNNLSDVNFHNQLVEFDDSIIAIRIASKLSKNSIDNLENKESGLEKDIFSAINISFEVKRNVLLDIIHCLLAVNESYITFSKEFDVNMILKKVKYVVIFLYPELEKEFLENNFEVNKNPYIGYRIFCQFNGLKKELINEVIIAYGVDIYCDIINFMLQYNNDDLRNYKIRAKLINEQSFIRAIFVLLDSETIMKLNSALHDMIDDEGMQERLKNKSKIIEMIIDSYSKVKKDRSIPKIISLKL